MEPWPYQELLLQVSYVAAALSDSEEPTKEPIGRCLQWWTQNEQIASIRVGNPDKISMSPS
jgi:hypothetical protein